MNSLTYIKDVLGMSVSDFRAEFVAMTPKDQAEMRQWAIDEMEQLGLA